MRRKRRRSKRAVAGLKKHDDLRLTSMMDILVVLLLFILKAFVAGGDVMSPPPGLLLPNSTAESTPQESLILGIDGDVLTLGSEKIATIDEIVNSNGMVIEKLDDHLQRVIKQREEIAGLRTSGEVGDEIVTIQGDRKIEFQVLQKVMYTLDYNGFENIALAVIKSS